MKNVVKPSLESRVQASWPEVIYAVASTRSTNSGRQVIAGSSADPERNRPNDLVQSVSFGGSKLIELTKEEIDFANSIAEAAALDVARSRGWAPPKAAQSARTPRR